MTDSIRQIRNATAAPSPTDEADESARAGKGRCAPQPSSGAIALSLVPSGVARGTSSPSFGVQATGSRRRFLDMARVDRRRGADLVADRCELTLLRPRGRLWQDLSQNQRRVSCIVHIRPHRHWGRGRARIPSEVQRQFARLHACLQTPKTAYVSNMLDRGDNECGW